MDRKNVRSLLTLLLIPFTLSIACSLALADAGQAAHAWPLVWIAPYVPILIPLIAGLQSIVVRGTTSATGFWHTPAGHVLLVFIGAALGTGLDFLKAGTFTKQAAIAAAAGAATAFFGAWKTSGKTDIGLPLPPTSKQAGRVSTNVIAVLAFVAFAACGTLYGQKYATCIEAKGIQAGQNIPGDVNTILTSGSPKDTAVNQLEGLAGQAAIDAVVCAVQAWLDSHPAPKNASPTPVLLAGRAAATEFLSRHPTKSACSPHTTL